MATVWGDEAIRRGGFTAEGAESAERMKVSGPAYAGEPCRGKDFRFLTALRYVRNDRVWGRCGMTGMGVLRTDRLGGFLRPSVCGRDTGWIQAFAGMTVEGLGVLVDHWSVAGTRDGFLPSQE